MIQAFNGPLNGFCYPNTQFWFYLMNKILPLFNAHNGKKLAWTTPEEVLQRAKEVREWFLNAIGGLPTCEDPVKVKKSSVLEYENFKIEKLLLEIAPSVYISTNLYVPVSLEKPVPAILFLCGHHLSAKAAPEYQRVCLELVRDGFVTLAMDPTGQGERISYWDPEEEETPRFWGVSEHAYQGLQCVLTGTSIARFFLFDALRVLDYLCQRPEVDSDRIGITGNSGGGTQTTLLCMSGDQRIKVAVPCTYVTSREHYVQTAQPQDAEQIQFELIKNCVDFDDMFLPFAPRPLLIGAVKDDFFNPEGTAFTYQRVQQYYRLLGAENNVACVFSPGSHMYSRELREVAINWFRVHLANKEPNFQTKLDEEITVFSEKTLWCTSKGSVRHDFPNTKTPFHLNLAYVPKRIIPNNKESLRHNISTCLKINERWTSAGPLFPRTTLIQNQKDLTISSIIFISEPGIWVSGALIKPNTSHSRVCVYLTDKGTDALEEILNCIEEKLMKDNEAAFLFDVRGIGAVKFLEMSAYTGPFPNTLLNSTSWNSWLTYCLGESLLGMRVFDVLRAFQYLREECNYKNIGLYAIGTEPSLWGYLAAALDRTIDPITIIGLILSFEDIVRTERYRYDVLPSVMVHGVLKFFDLPELRSLFADRNYNIQNCTVNACDI